MKKIIIAIGLMATLSGCLIFQSTQPAGDPRTWARDENGVVLNRIPGTQSIDIPAGLTDGQALDAVERAVVVTTPDGKTNYWSSKWRLEGRDPQERWIRVGLQVRQHYVCVCYRIEGRQLVPDVPTSTNLRQDGIRIHPKVPVWINSLKPNITMQMYGFLNGKVQDGSKASAPPPIAPKEPINVISLVYDSVTHKGTIRVRFPEGCYTEARQRARNDIEHLARDKGASLRTGDRPDEALYRIGAESVQDGVLVMEFTTE